MYSEAVILTPDCTISEDCFSLITSAFGRLNLLGESCGFSRPSNCRSASDNVCGTANSYPPIKISGALRPF